MVLHPAAPPSHHGPPTPSPPLVCSCAPLRAWLRQHPQPHSSSQHQAATLEGAHIAGAQRRTGAAAPRRCNGGARASSLHASRREVECDCPLRPYTAGRSGAAASATRQRLRATPAASSVDGSQEQEGVQPFGRAHEADALKALCGSKPTGITLLLGSHSSGKSQLLLQLLAERGLAGSVCNINCRRLDAASPEAFASALLRLGVPHALQGLQGQLLESVKEGAEVAAVILSEVSDASAEAGFCHQQRDSAAGHACRPAAARHAAAAGQRHV